MPALIAGMVQASTRHRLLHPSLLTDDERLRGVQVISGLGLIAGVVLSIPLWLSRRAFPLVPRLAFVPSLPPPLDLLALVLLLTLAALIVLRRRPGRVVAGLAILVALLIATDQTRCQPWVFQYVVMLLVAVPPSGEREGADATARLDALRVMVAAIYFWSGIQKLNVVFFGYTSLWLIEPITQYLPEWAGPAIRSGAQAIPFVETFIGIGLLVPRLRRAALMIGVAMHLFVLHVLGPLGHDANSVVWPWNVAMLGFIWLLFTSPRGNFRPAWSSRPALLRRLALIAFAVLPAFNVVGLWDFYLSWSLSSGVKVFGTIHVDDAALGCLPESVRRQVKTVDGANVISVWDWALDVLNVPPYPERWVYRRLRDQLCVCDPRRDLIAFEIWAPARWRETEPETYRCGDVW